jgi:hypothetical protein
MIDGKENLKLRTRKRVSVASEMRRSELEVNGIEVKLSVTGSIELLEGTLISIVPVYKKNKKSSAKDIWYKPSRQETRRPR